MKLKIGLVAIAWFCLVSADSSQPSQRTLNYIGKIGELAPQLAENLACAKDQIGISQFEILKNTIGTNFGDKAAQDLQEVYDRIRVRVEIVPPSQRRVIVAKMKCIEHASELTDQINAIGEDANWSAGRDMQKK